MLNSRPLYLFVVPIHRKLGQDIDEVSETSRIIYFDIDSKRAHKHITETAENNFSGEQLSASSWHEKYRSPSSVDNPVHKFLRPCKTACIDRVSLQTAYFLGVCRIAAMPLLIVSRAVILDFFHIPRSIWLDMKKSPLLEHRVSQSAALLSTASTVFWGSRPHLQHWSSVFHPSREDRENPRKQESGEDEKNHSLVKKLRCGGVGELIFFDTRSGPPSPGDPGL
jgi:hypothetical protein